MELLILLISLIILGFLTGCLSIFIDFCMNDGNIFDFYYLYITKYENTHPKIFKLIGGCVFCFGTWVYISLFLLISILYNINILLIFLGLGINYITIKKLTSSN